MIGTQARKTEHLRLLLGAALAGASLAAASLAPTPASAAEQPTAFVAPADPLLLTRELRKSLVDGNEVVSRRHYEVRFVPTPHGWRVDGQLLGAEVEAPPELAELAEIERTRADDDLFPLQLDAAGQILPQPRATDAGTAAQVSQAATRLLASAQLSPAERQSAMAMVARLQAEGQATGGTWPADLFRAAPGTQTRQRDIPLADGSSGQVTVTLTVAGHAVPQASLPARVQRRIVTDLAGTTRQSVETWTLAPAR